MGKYIVIAALLILYLIGIALLFGVYLNYGVWWDFLVHYLNAKSILQQGFLAHASQWNTKSIYFEAERGPLSPAILSIFIFFANSYAIPAYLAIYLMGLIVCGYYFSKVFGLNAVLVCSLLITPFILIIGMLLNGGEALSLALLLLSMAAIKKDKAYSGMLLALACMAKYFALIFLPLLLLLNRPKKIVYSYFIFILTTLPWLIFNYIIYGNPLYSYLEAMSFFTNPSGYWPVTKFILAGIVAIAFVAILKTRIQNKQSSPRLLERRKSKFILVSFLALSLLEFALLAPSADHPTTLARFGIALYASIALIIAYKVSEFGSVTSKAVIYAALLLSIAISIYVILIIPNNPSISGYIGNYSMSITNATQVISAQNLSRCGIVSNAWVYLRYYNVSAFPPFSYNSTTRRYPAIVFRYIGVNKTYVAINNYTKAFSDKYLSLYLPDNYLC